MSPAAREAALCSAERARDLPVVAGNDVFEALVSQQLQGGIQAVQQGNDGGVGGVGEGLEPVFPVKVAAGHLGTLLGLQGLQCTGAGAE